MQDNTTATPLSETVEIFDDNTEWVQLLLKEAETSSVAQKLKGAAIVSLETALGGHHLQEFYGVNIALRELKKNPDRLIICYGFAPLELIRKQNPIVDVLLSKPNVLLIRMPFLMDDLASALQKAEAEKPKLAAEAQQGAKAMSDYVAREVSEILHGLKLVNPKHPTNDYERSMVQRAVTRAKEFFPALAHASDEEIIDFLYEAGSHREEVMKGEKVAGVFSDIEGTLLKDGNINQAVLEMLQKYAEEGKTITVWTDGDVNELSSKLKELGIPYPVKSKFDFAGAIAEIVLDDMDELTFTARSKICAEKFIRIR